VLTPAEDHRWSLSTEPRASSCRAPRWSALGGSLGWFAVAGSAPEGTASAPAPGPGNPLCERANDTRRRAGRAPHLSAHAGSPPLPSGPLNARVIATGSDMINTHSWLSRRLLLSSLCVLFWSLTIAVAFSAVAFGDSPPTVTTEQAQDLAPTHATLTGLINPEGLETTYYFEYGTTTAYGISLPSTQDADAGSAEGAEIEQHPIYGLHPGTTYHYRIVATNPVGTTHGNDQTFTTGVEPPASTPRDGIPGAGFLPDDRGWEKVSPNDKNGGDIMADTGRTRVADDGSAASFASLVAFGDVIGTSVATDYMSVRGLDGWITHAITPYQDPDTPAALIPALESEYVGEFSADLSGGAFVGTSPVTPDPTVSDVTNMYVRSDLRSAGSGSYQLLSACQLCAIMNSSLPPLVGHILGGGEPRFADASADFEHVIFESQQPLTSETAGDICSDLADLNSCPGKLYEWNQGTVRLAGILPDSACGSPPCVPAAGSQAGQGVGSFQYRQMLAPHTISADGSRIFFTVPDSPQSLSGALYMRVNHATTVQLNAYEPSSDPGSPSAMYWDATDDGRHVFFTSPDALTTDAPTTGEQKIYMYDTSKLDSDPHNLTLVSVDHEPADPADVQTVLGVSADGHYVYFAAVGQLVAGQPVLGTVRALYAWHDGTIRYITSIGGSADLIENATTTDTFFYRPTARVTPDGLHLLFSSTQPSGPTGYSQGNCNEIASGCRELYIYSYTSQRLTCASCNPSGAPATASALTAVRTRTAAAVTSTAQTHPLSDDGGRVFFGTTEALSPKDVNGKSDVYEYDVPNGTVHLISTGIDRFDSFFMGATPSGSDVFFLTRQQLTSSDRDNNYDMYDARKGGGFLQPPPSPECVGDACRGPKAGAPEAPARGSSLITGGTPPVKVKPKRRACRRGYVHKKVRGKSKCVKKRRHRRAHKATRAGHVTLQRRAK